MQKTTNSADETKKLAENYAKKLKGGEIIALFGDLGSGKTTFVQGLAKGLGIKENITSPTFIILNLYKIKNGLTLAHFDLYRLKGEADFEGVGATDYLGKKDIISVIEWPERANKALPKKTIWIKFEHIAENKRKITFK